MSEEDFVDLTPPGRPPARVADVVLTTFRIRGALRLGLSISRDLFDADRVLVAWNRKTFELRLTPDDRGTFDLSKPARGGKRKLLRLELPAGLQIADRKEPGPCRKEGKVLFVIVPPPMRAPIPKADAIAAARAALPAPSFSTRKL